jgi:hypothetical protein
MHQGAKGKGRLCVEYGGVRQQAHLDAARGLELAGRARCRLAQGATLAVGFGKCGSEQHRKGGGEPQCRPRGVDENAAARKAPQAGTKANGQQSEKRGNRQTHAHCRDQRDKNGRTGREERKF